MTILDHDPRRPLCVLDHAFLKEQTFGDADLQRDVLILFEAQALRVIAAIPTLSEAEQSDAAHLLVGSARGIGAWNAAAMAESFERSNGDGRIQRFPDLVSAVDAVIAEIGTARAASGRLDDPSHS